MPYKNPEDKRRWEQEHREERNARRRELRLGPAMAKQADPVQQPKSGWQTVIALMLGAGIAAVGAIAGIRLSKLR